MADEQHRRRLRLARELQAQRQRIEDRGGNIDTYIRRFGPEQGVQMFAEDAARLRDLEAGWKLWTKG